MASRRDIVVAWLPAALYMLLIWVLSSLHLTDFPVRELPLHDKGVHFVEYAVLGLLVAHASLRTWPRHAPLRTLGVAVLIALGWGVLDEIHQAFVPGRQADVWDLVADAVGAASGAALRFGARLLRRGTARILG